MTRKEFLSKIPPAAAFALSISCFGSCGKRLLEETNETTSLSTDTEDSPYELKEEFQIDLADPLYFALLSPGGYAYFKNVILVYTEDREYLAGSKICSDEFLPDIIWENGEFLCKAHGATFDKNGTGTQTYNNLGRFGLGVYNTEKNGNILRVFP